MSIASGGPGFYMVLHDFFVFRVDVGLSEEGMGVYVTSDHVF